MIHHFIIGFFWCIKGMLELWMIIMGDLIKHWQMTLTVIGGVSLACVIIFLLCSAFDNTNTVIHDDYSKRSRKRRKYKAPEYVPVYTAPQLPEKSYTEYARDLWNLTGIDKIDIDFKVIMKQDNDVDKDKKPDENNENKDK